MQKRQSRGRLGEFLIEAGHLRGNDLERALEIQRVAGGHLGTNLLEMGVIAEAVLLEAIGKLHENPTVPGRRLLDIPREVSLKVPRELVRRHSIVPFALHGNTVYIASQRPGDIHIENEVTLATSRLTRTFIGLEVRVQEALHAHHGHSLPLRFSRLTERLDGTPPTTVEAETVKPTVSIEAPAQDRKEWISSSKEFDPTLASTASKQIDWNTYDLTKEKASSPGQSAVEGTDSLPSARPPSASDTAKSQSQPESAEQAADTNTPAPSKAVPSFVDATSPEARTSVTQFPFAVRAKRKRNPESRLPRLQLNTTSGASEPQKSDAAEIDLAARRATVEPEELQSVSSAHESADRHLPDAHAALLEATNRDAVARIVMKALRPFFSRRLLLAKRGDQLRGWLADGPGIQPNKLLSLSFPLASGTPFLSIKNGSRFWLGAYHRDSAYQLIEEILGPVRPPDCMVFPLRAGAHIVGFLYGDNERNTVTGQPLSEFLELSEAAGTAFERIIRRIRESQGESDIESSSPAESLELDPWSISS